jgi:2'-5' RNA ligase
LVKAKTVLKKTSQSLVSFPLSFEQIGVFPGPNLTVFWGLVVTKEFLEIHASIHRQFCEFSALPDFVFYTPGNWIPHYGVAMEINEPAYISKIVESCLSLPNPHTAWITEIGLISFRPVRQLLCVPLAR